ncbi:hypothetical protein A3H22_00115 [Candidatus Peribacteria bacterium RIFCSPLOWO2_12_FULL_55_15]|nr:MAG: hypothetical protein A2789_01340 [Candidatus Peribacteria bacterium RIFCSPHIGHO2_01_FULL_54_22]OGJ63100.1 MAG: hypothetical protein A3D12_02665 [Candidatus Peribacteria bacterium RIFCSPHIGHO2_02_FULL_55_24]OGJ68982.1 MAG: hypothetical protein A2947_03990 [Candidatus Peribacteria bacterium RIFCSPLOWO2_01_FULL_54_110]OGJ70162.1 MAG: hypothetical protein A3H90_00455 [Candidatus Peribacteria bacterium RIFCSPLOWO2_02_FULL_55_36]OGJ71664.1 MAG: hypothetical protein A3H22_00115 [Candidatus Per
MPLDSPEGSQDEIQEGGTVAPEKGNASGGLDYEPRRYDGEFVERLMKIYKSGSGVQEQQKTGERRRQLFVQLSLTDEQFIASYESVRDFLREEVVALLVSLQKKEDSEKLKTLEPKFLDTVQKKVDDTHVPLGIAELKQYHVLLVREVGVQGKDPERIIRSIHSVKEEDGHQRHMIVVRDVELGLQLQALEMEKPKRVEEALEGRVSKQATALSTLLQIRKDVSAALRDIMQKKHEQSFDPVVTMDAFYAEIDMECRSKQEQQLPEKILGLFGRSGKKKPFYLEKELFERRHQCGAHIERDRFEWALGILCSQKKIAFLSSKHGEEAMVCRDPAVFTYTPEELESVLDASLYDQLGHFVSMGVATSPNQKMSVAYLRGNDTILGIPSEIAEQMMLSYEKAGCVKKKEGGGDKPAVYSLDEKICQGRAPSSAMLTRMQHVKDVVVRAMEEKSSLAKKLVDEVDSLSEETPEAFMRKLKEYYRKYDAKRVLKQFTSETEEGREPLVMHFTNMQLGHACYDPEFMDDFLAYLQKNVFSKNEKKHIPTMIVIHAGKHGNYKYQRKKRQRLAVTSIDVQYESENEFFRLCLKLKKEYGITVVYNMSHEDELSIEHYAMDTALRLLELERQRERAERDAMRGRATSATGPSLVSQAAGAGIINYKQVDQVRQTSLYTYLHEFWWDVAYPYSCKVGRELGFDEFLSLQKAYDDLVGGNEPSDEIKSVIDVTKIPLPGRRLEDEEIIIVDDYQALLKRKGGEDITIRGSRSVRGTESSASKDPLDSLRDRVGHMHAKRNIRKRLGKTSRIDDEPPDVWGTFDQNLLSAEMVGGDHGSLIYSTPTLRRGRMDLSSFAKIQDDNLWRALFNRKDPVTPGVMALRFSKDGRFSYDIYNETLMALSEVSKHRAAIFLTSDWQVGSITARTEYLIKMLTMFWHDIAAKYPEVYALANGDENHGYNYIMAGQEGEPFGLPQIRDQNRWITRTNRNILSCVPKENKRNVKAWHITNGNHEDNKALMQYGTSHQHPLEVVLDLMSEGTYETYYHDYEYSRARKGVVYKGSMMTEKVAGHNIFARHYLLERFGKGSGGNPANQGRDLLASQAMQMALVDFLLFSHFHNHRMICVGDKPVIGNLAAADPSYYESMRAYLDAIGCTVIYLGGSLPPTVEVVTKKALDNYKMPKEAFYADENKNMSGYETDPGWDPDEHGLINAFLEKGKSSALQKKVAAEMWDIKRRMSQGYPDEE